MFSRNLPPSEFEFIKSKIPEICMTNDLNVIEPFREIKLPIKYEYARVRLVLTKLINYFIDRVVEIAREHKLLAVDVVKMFKFMKHERKLLELYPKPEDFAEVFNITICLDPDEVCVFEILMSFIKTELQDDEEAKSIIRQLMNSLEGTCFRVSRVQYLIKLFTRIRQKITEKLIADQLQEAERGETEETSSNGGKGEEEEEEEGEE